MNRLAWRGEDAARALSRLLSFIINEIKDNIAQDNDTIRKKAKELCFSLFTVF